MTTPLAGITEADWAATPVDVRACFLELVSQCQKQHEEIEQLRAQLTALASELASLQERISRTSRNSSNPPSSDTPGYCCTEALRATSRPDRRKGSGRKRGGQRGHPGSGPELLPIERVDEVVEHHPDACRDCGTLLHCADHSRSAIR
jgi:transposase